MSLLLTVFKYKETNPVSEDLSWEAESRRATTDIPR